MKARGTPARPSDSSGRWEDRAYPTLLVVASLAAYLAIACPYVLGGDSGELLALAARGGVAHPPGYPLFTLLMQTTGRWLSSSPVLGPVRANAVIAALAAGVLYAACRSFRASPGASLLAGATYASSPLAWLYATQLEVFALNALLVATLLWVSGPECTLRGGRRLAGLALVAGLAVSHHHTILALAPVGLLGVGRALREQTSARRLRAIALALAAFTLGLTPYAYLVWASHHASDAGGRWVWGDSMSLQDLLRHVERVAYWQQGARDRRVPVPVAHWAALAVSLERGLLWVGVPLVFAGIVAPFVPRSTASTEATARRWDAVAVVAAILLAGPALLALLIDRPVGVYALVVERFYLLPLQLASLPLAWGLDVGLSRVRPSVAGVLTGTGVVVVAAINGGTVPARVREAERPTVEQYLRNTLAELPSNAVVFGVGDHRCFGFFFLQTILGVRADVSYVEAGMLREAWYRDRVARALGAPVASPSATELAGALVDAGRPVFVTDSFEDLVPAEHASYALGTVERVLPAGTEPPAPEAVEALNLEVARGFVREASAPCDPWSWSGEVDATYARPWLMLARTFGALGQLDRARLDERRALSRHPADVR